MNPPKADPTDQIKSHPSSATCQVFEIFRWTWKAYPKLQPMSPENWASFRLMRGFHFCCQKKHMEPMTAQTESRFWSLSTLPRNKSIGETLLNSYSIIMYYSLSVSEEFPWNMTVCFPDWLQQLQPTPSSFGRPGYCRLDKRALLYTSGLETSASAMEAPVEERRMPPCWIRGAWYLLTRF